MLLNSLLLETLLKMHEDDIRIYIQEMSRHHFDDDQVITELESIHSELLKSNLAIPRHGVELQDLSLLTAEALDRVRSNTPSPTYPLSTQPYTGDPHRLMNGHIPVINGHANGLHR